jgi:mannose-6-phosphate isomerase
VAEVQTPSDTTFRVFDWNRNDPARPLHVQQAMECILFGAAQRLPERPITNLARSSAAWSDGLRAAVLCANEHFEIEAIEASPSGDAAPMECVTDHAPVVLMLVRGEAVMESEGHRPIHLRAGDTVLLPAELVPTTIDLAPESLLVRTTMPDPARRIHDGLGSVGNIA